MFKEQKSDSLRILYGIVLYICIVNLFSLSQNIQRKFIISESLYRVFKIIFARHGLCNKTVVTYLTRDYLGAAQQKADYRSFKTSLL